MHFRTPLVLAAAALTGHAAAAFRDMELRDIYTNTFEGGNVTAENRRITFHITDHNSNTTTCCSAPWTESSNGTVSGRPAQYTACDATGRAKEGFWWYFSRYDGLGGFELQVEHAYSDPVTYPPPWDVVELFTTVNITLQCTQKNGETGCTLPPGTSVKAPINAAVD